MTVDGLEISPTPCPTCGTALLEVADHRGKRRTLEATPHPNGSTIVHGTTGRIVAQAVGQDAARAFRRSTVPVYREHPSHAA